MAMTSMSTALARISPEHIRRFRRKVLRFYRRHGRDLLFRHTTDPYRIAVAEIMLQQTQVERVVPKLQEWFDRWPSWESLAGASDRELLTAWSGLGYNRRALYLGRLARTVISELGGQLPADERALRRLPGIGTYTARAILVFAYGQRVAAVDTNVRRVIVHEFQLAPGTPVAEIDAVAERILPRRNVREWHNALMDYSRLRLPSQLPGYRSGSRQSRFAGSRRQIRGEIIRQLTKKSRVSFRVIARLLEVDETDVRAAATALAREGVVGLSATAVRLARSRDLPPG